MATNMHNKRTKILVAGNLRKWEERLLKVRAYEVDIIVVSRESTPTADCPLAIEVFPTGYLGHLEENCGVLSPENQALGKAILKDVKNVIPGEI
ncbi:UNVERIFIED_CONTAM: hypothetical protein NCL1_52200 [Trichonephila clavipes]